MAVASSVVEGAAEARRDAAAGTRRPPTRRGTRRRVALLGLAALALATAVLGAARWVGEAPVGSDNDEYRLVAAQLASLDAPVVAGVEGTKYPLGWPALLAVLDRLGLPVVGASQALNVALAGATAALAALAVRHRGPVAAAAAAGLVLASRPLWAATQSTMPDVALAACVAAALAVVAVARSGRAAAVALAAVTVAATALKSVGLLLGLAGTAALLAARRLPWRLVALPAGAGVAASLLGVAAVARHPEHTTGYARTFWLADPYDAAAGHASLLEVAGRLATRLDLVATDAAKAVWGGLVEGWPAWLLTAALVGAGVAGARGRAFVAAFVAVHVGFLALWPYSSVRFGLALLPVAAVGAGTLAAAAADRLRLAAVPATGAAVTAVAALVVAAVPALDAEATREAALYRRLDGARREVAAWLDVEAPGAVVVSPDYRELATVLGPPVHPLPYTSDAGDLLADALAGTHLVAYRGLYAQRDQVVDTLLAAHGDRFELVHANDLVQVWAVRR